jgi:hypothetical protein
MNSNNRFRLPVMYQGKPLMPMSTRRVRKYIASGKARMCYDRKLRIHTLELLVAPSGFNTQEVTIGLDPGSTFDGFSVVSSKVHHLNVELIQRPKKGKNSIRYFKARQASNRRVRRCRLRHRRCRFEFRTGSKLPPTIQANIDFRKWLLSRLVKIYPVTTGVVEDVRFNHAQNSKGRAFSLVEQGKTELYRFISDLGVKLELRSGYDTKKLRIAIFGVDLKSKVKDSKDFNAHCIDSFVLARNPPMIEMIDTETGEVTQSVRPANRITVNQKVLFIEKVVKIRRCLTRLRVKYKAAKNYYRLLKTGIKQVYQNFSQRRNISRIKLNDEKSNHPFQWVYINNGPVERLKHAVAPYGGTVFNGVKKFYQNDEWVNRKLNYA